MRRFDLSPFVVLPLSALIGLAAACATAPIDEDPGSGYQVAEQNTQPKEEETNSAKLPAPSNPQPSNSSTSSSSGESSSSGGSSTSSSGGSTSSSGGSTSSSSGGSTSSSGGSTSSSSSSSSSGGGGASCDMGNPLNIAKAFAELDKPTPRTCGLMGGTCTATECCFDVYGVCIDP